MKKTINPEAPAQAAANPVLWRCKVTKAGAGKSYGADRHKKGRGARVLLDETQAAAAEGQGWITREGLEG